MRTEPRTLCIATVLGTASLFASTTRAQVSPSRSAAVRLHCCPAHEIQRPLILEALRTELRDEGVRDIVERPQRDSLLIDIEFECAKPTQAVHVRVADPRLVPVRRDIDIGDLDPRLAPRAIALATAELARTMWMVGRPIEHPAEDATSIDVTPAESASPLRDNAPATAASGNTPAPLLSGQASTSTAAPTHVQSSADALGSSASAAVEVGDPKSRPPTPAVEPADAKPVSPGSSGADPSSTIRTHPGGAAVERTAPVPKQGAVLSRTGMPLVLLGGAALVFIEHPTAMFGGELSAQLGRFRAGVEALVLSAGDSLGQVSLSVLATSVSIELYEIGSPKTTLAMAPRATVGRAAAVGAAVQHALASSASEPYLEGGIEIRLRTSASALLGFEASAAVGYATGLTALANQAEIAKIGGPLARTSIGATWDFWRRPAGR